MNVFLKEEIPERWHFKNNARITSIFIVTDPGYETYDVSLLFCFIGISDYKLHKCTLMEFVMSRQGSKYSTTRKIRFK